MQPLANSQPLSVTDVLDRSLVLRTTGTPSGRRSSVASPSNLRRALPAGPSPAGERQLEGLDSQRRPTSASTGLAGSRHCLRPHSAVRSASSWVAARGDARPVCPCVRPPSPRASSARTGSRGAPTAKVYVPQESD
ncbi:unnamed protein product [Prorocentrum cordatum]|uniref:Uncharacterized protein n=1 Tax=Prorocentrum cordatum TaxID=2364126 RepID=A0ABN9W1Y0_9DINO|nr:unnamed protein product [Polarella glacialis]